MVTCRGKVTNKTEKNGEKIVEGDLEVVNQKGEAAIKGIFAAALRNCKLREWISKGRTEQSRGALSSKDRRLSTDFLDKLRELREKKELS